MDIFNDFVNTLLHNGSAFCDCTISAAHASVWITFENQERNPEWRLFKNEPGIAHSEYLVVKYIEATHQDQRIQTVKVLANYSPCYDCAIYIKRHLDTHPEIHWELRFVGLYNIIRNSCDVGGHPHLTDIQEKSDTNKNGLRQLDKTTGLGMGTFTNIDWIQLGNDLEVSRADVDIKLRVTDRLHEDDVMKDDLEILLN